MSPLSRRDWKRAAKKAAQGSSASSPIWDLAGYLLFAVIIIAILDAIFGK